MCAGKRFSLKNRIFRDSKITVPVGTSQVIIKSTLRIKSLLKRSFILLFAEFKDPLDELVSLFQSLLKVPLRSDAFLNVLFVASSEMRSEFTNVSRRF